MRRALLLTLLLAFGCAEDRPQPLDKPTPLEAVPEPKVEPSKQAAGGAIEPPPSLEDDAHFGGGGDGKLHVYFMNVGHGDATLIVSPVGKTVLIDAGPKEASARLLHKLPELLNDSIDLLVLTQPHPEHFGAIPAVVKAVGAKRFLDPRLPAEPNGYGLVLEEMRARKIPIFVPAPDPKLPGDPLRIKLGGGADLVVFWPRLPQESLIDAAARTAQVNSLVVRLEFRDTSLLLASDAQMETERLLLKRRLPFESTLLRVASHGSDAASTGEFLAAVKPLGAIISVGAGNAEGMPSRAVTERLEKAGARVFRTDLDGDIEAWSDGKSFNLSVERPPAGEPVGTEYVFARNVPTKSFVNPESAKAQVKKEQPASTGKRDTSVTMDLSDGAGAGSKHTAVAAKETQKEAQKEESFKKVVNVDSDALIPDAVKAKYGSKTTKTNGKSTYVASKNSKVFHFPDCVWAKKIKKENLLTFSSRNEAAKRFKPAGDCNP